VVHTLADEMNAWAIDLVRAYMIIDRTIGALQRPHPALVPANIVIDDEGYVKLVDQAAAVAPYRAPEATLDEKSNVYSLGVILGELLGTRTELARDVLDAAHRPYASERPTLERWRGMIATTGWHLRIAGTWYPPFVPGAMERALVDGVRDEGGRDVYADWLEQHGVADRARFLRAGEPAPPEDARWRALVSDARLESCFDKACSKRWATLVRTTADNVRDCTRCTRQVHYCPSLATVQNEARRGVPIAIDAALAGADVSRALVTMHVPTYVGPPGNPPHPRSYAEGAPGGSVLTRLFGLFRRR
jgi:uncharacterized protein (TIGR02996 family)